MGACTGWAIGHLPTLKIFWVGITHPEFSFLRIVWMRTAHPGFCAKTMLYYDNCSISITKLNNILGNILLGLMGKM